MAEASRIGVKNLQKRHTVSFGGGAYTVELDAMSYVYGALRSTGSSQELKDVCRALWAYGEAFTAE